MLEDVDREPDEPLSHEEAIRRFNECETHEPHEAFIEEEN
jgi:hypothetical protein